MYVKMLPFSGIKAKLTTKALFGEVPTSTAAMIIVGATLLQISLLHFDDSSRFG